MIFGNRIDHFDFLSCYWVNFSHKVSGKWKQTGVHTEVIMIKIEAVQLQLREVITLQLLINVNGTNTQY